MSVLYEPLRMYGAVQADVAQRRRLERAVHGLERTLRVAAHVGLAFGLQADVVEAVVGEVVAHVAHRALRLVLEQLEAVLGRGAHCLLIAFAPAIERRLGGEHGALEARESARHGHRGDAHARVSGFELRGVARDGLQALDELGQRQIHFARRFDRAGGLIFERGLAAIPHLDRVERGVHDGRRGARQRVHVEADRGGQSVRPAERRVVAARAAHRHLARQARIEEQQLAEHALARASADSRAAPARRRAGARDPAPRRRRLRARRNPNNKASGSEIRWLSDF